MKTNTTLKNLGENIRKGLSGAQHFLKKSLTGKNRPYGIIAAVVAGILVISLATLATPPSSWIALTSSNCLTQGAGNTMVEAPGPGGRSYLYVLFGGNNTFKRFDPLGITGTDSLGVAGGTGDCASTNLANAPVSISAGASMVKVGSNMIYVYPGGTGALTYIYFINEDLWIKTINATAKADDTATSPPIQSYASTSDQYDGTTITSVGTDVYIANGNGASTLAKYTPSTNSWTSIATSGQPNFVLGATMTAVGTDLYVLPGSANTFKKLDTTTSTWSTLATAPATVGAGSSIAYPGSGDYLYVLKGNNNNAVWKYCYKTSGPSVADPTTQCTDAQANSWSGTNGVTTPTAIPGLVSNGGTLMYPGSGDYLYALQGSNTKNVWRYCLPGASGCTPDTWSALAKTPATVASGGSLISDGGTSYLYASRGNNSKDFWRYTIGTDTWENISTTPVIIGRSYSVGQQYSGGGLTYVCPTAAPCPGTGTIYMTSGRASTSSFTAEYPLFRFPLSGTNAGKWPVYSALPGISGNYGTSFAYPGASAQDPTGDFLYKLYASSYGLEKYSLLRQEFIPWNRSKLDYVNPFTGLTESDTLINHPNPSSTYQQGLGSAISEANGKMYVLNGNSTQIFSSFDPVRNIWTDLTNSPAIIYTGATMVKKDNQNLYIQSGNNQSTFLRYYVPTDDWIPFNRSTLDNGDPIAQEQTFTQSNGTTMTVANGKFYLINSSNAGYIEIYDPVTNSWTTGSQVATYTPTTPNTSPSPGINPGNGAAMIGIGTDVYVLPGNTSSGSPNYNAYFLKYDTTTNTWSQKASIPTGSPQENVGPGTSLTYVPSLGKIYALKGNGSRQFFSYTIATDTWSNAGTLASTPTPIGGGGSLVALGSDTLFAFAGNNTRNFWKYTISTDTWTTLTNPPPVGISSGAALTTDGTNLYATAGNYTKTFGKYTITNSPNPGDGTWSQLQDAPSRVGANCGNINPCTVNKGSLVYYNNGGYDELWMVSGNGVSGVSTSITDDGGSIFRYTITNANPANNNTWPMYKRPAPTPLTIATTGTAMAYPGTGNLLYYLRGNSTTDFWSYDTVNNNWNAAPLGKLDSGTLISQSNYDSTGATATQARGNTMIEVNNELYIVNGSPSSGNPPGTSLYSFQKYTPATNTWTNLADIPTSSSGAGISDGASMTSRDTNGDSIPDTIYLYRGNFSNDFWRYDIPTNTWFSFNIATKDDGTPLAQTDKTLAGSTQSSGSQVIEVNGKMYVSTGLTNDLEFEKYDPATNTWSALPSPLIVGAGVTAMYMNTGTSMTKAGNQIYAMVVTSGSQSYLEKFDTVSETWTYVATAPVQFSAGSGIAYMGEVDGTTSNDTDFIYATRGGSTTTAYRYCLQNTGSGCTVGTWTALTAAPTNIYGGGSMTPMVVGGTPYVFVIAGGGLSPGANTTFFRWNIRNASNGSWDLLPNNQPPESIASGGSITNDGTYIYVTRGGNSISMATKSFWRYNPAAASGSRWSAMSDVPGKMGENSTGSSRGGITYCSSCGTGEIWAVPGNGRNGFVRSGFDAETGALIYRYRISDNTWPYAERTRPAPSTISGGGALTYPGNGDFVYGTQGGSSTNFWTYDVVMNEWNAFSRSKLDSGKPLSQPSVLNSSGTSEVQQGPGNSILQANNKFYVLEGNNQANFMEYNPATNKWRTLSPVPDSNGTNYGASMVGVDSTLPTPDGVIDDIYVMKGGTLTNFWRYNIATNAWTPASGTGALQNVPAAVYYGGSITYPGSGDYLYATSGNGTGFYKYCFRATIAGAATATQCSNSTPTNQTNSWSGTNGVASVAAVTGSMLGGSALTSVGGDIYALRGGAATSDFYKYTIATNTWSTLTSPTWTSSGQVAAGGSLTNDGVNIYASKGNNNPDIRKCTLSAGNCTWSTITSAPVNIGTASSSTAYGGLAYTPSGPSGGAELFMVPGTGSAGNPINGVGWIYRMPFTGTNANTWPMNEITPAMSLSASSGTSLLSMGATSDLMYETSGGSNGMPVFDRTVNEWTLNGFTKSVIDSSNHRISQGGATQGNGNSIVRASIDASTTNFYVMAGNGTTTFQKYSPTTNRWTTLATTPVAVNSGGSLVAVDTDGNGYEDTIYAFGGNTTTNFWSYSIANNTWTTMATAPLTVSAGGALSYPGSGDYLFAFRGGATTTFWKYCFRATISGAATATQCSTDTPSNQTNSWSGTNGVTTPAVAPATVQGGGSLANVGSNTIYAFGGNNTNNFWEYNIPNDRWNNAGDGGDPADPTWTSGGSVVSGGSLISDGTDIYAMKGNAAVDMKKFTVSSGTWSNLQNTPASVGSAGGTTTSKAGMAYWPAGPSGGGEIFIVTGNGVNGNANGNSQAVLYRYIIGSDTWPTVPGPANAPATFSSGASLVKYDATTLYASQGYTSPYTNIWRYNIPNNRWNNAADAPVGAPAQPASSPVVVGNSSWPAGGLAMVPSGPSGGPELWLTSGNGYTGTSPYGAGLLYRHPFTGPNANTWPIYSVAPAPAPSSVSQFGGSALVGINSSTILALPSGFNNVMWTYNIPNNRWNSALDGGQPPGLPAGVTTSYGVSLTTDGSGTKAWATRGNNTSEIYRLDYNAGTPTSSTWTPQSGGGSLANAPVPFGYSSYGGQIVYSNNTLWGITARGTSWWYHTPGGNGGYTDLIYRYDIAGNTWPVMYQAADVPTIQTFEAGSDLAASPDGLKIFALRGSSSTPTIANPNMWSYAVSATGPGTWTALPNLPNNTSPLKIQSGGSLVATDNNTLYATVGSNDTSFYRFDYNSGTPSSSTWTAKGSLPAAMGQTGTGDERGELAFSSQYGSIFATTGNDTSSPFTIYGYPLIRATISCVTATTGAPDCGSPVTPTAGQPFSIVVSALDQNDTPYSVAANTDVTVSLKTGNGALGGTVTGTITSGNSSTVINGLTYSVPDGGIILSVRDTTSPANITTLATSDSDPFSVNPANPIATSIATNPVTTPPGGPTGGRTGVTVNGSNFYTNYTRPITINSPGTLTNYQVKVTVNTQSLISAGKMKSDCSDVMFSDIVPSKPYSSTPGGNKLGYWLEGGCNTGTTSFWVKANSLASGNNTIYMSYGDFRNTSASNGDNTFVFFDDFTGTTINTGKWLLTNPNSGVSVNNKLVFNGACCSANGIHSIVDGTDGNNDVNTDFDRANGQVLEFDLNHPSQYCSTLVSGWKDPTSTLGLYSTAVGSGGFIHAISGFCYYTNTTSDVYENGTSSDSDNSQNLNQNQSYKIRIIMRPASAGNGAVYQRSLDGGNSWITWKTTTARSDATAKIGFSSYGQTAEIDNVRVRQYSATEPTVTVGSESPNLTVTFDGTPGNVESVTSSAIVVSSPIHAGTGPVDVVINDAVGSTSTLSGAFTYGAVTITGISPDSDLPDGGAAVSITGANFNPSAFVRPVTITNGGAALSNYQVQITVDTATLISEGRLLPDGGDIRFYSDAALTTPLTYFVEGPMNSAGTKIWIKVPSIAATPTPTTIYMTYGNPSLTSQSSTSTFAGVLSNAASAFWTMDEASGTTVSDSSGNGNTGTMNGTNSSTNVVPGRFGNARTFDGSTNYVNVLNSSTLSPTSLSIEIWYQYATSQSCTRLLSKSNSSLGAYEIIHSCSSYSGKPYLSFNGGNAPNIGVLSATSAPSFNVWHHIVGTFDAATKTANFYLDGVQQETNSASPFNVDLVVPNSLNLNIGQYVGNGCCKFSGTLDEVHLYNRALTSTEVSQLYSKHPFLSSQFPGTVFIRELPAGSDPEPAASVGTETGRIPVTFDTTFSANVLDAGNSLISLIAPDHNPPGAATVPVVVTNAGDNATASTMFIYGIPPSITPPLSPNEGPKEGGTSVTINGSDFSTTADPYHPCSLPVPDCGTYNGLAVTFDGLYGTITSFSPTQLVVTTPAHTGTGPVDVVVSNPNTQSASLTGGFTYTTTTDPGNSTVTPAPSSAEGDGIDSSIITVQLLDNSSPTPFAAPNKLVELTETAQAPGDSNIDAVNCTTGLTLGNTPSYQGTSGGDGKVCFKVRTEPASTATATLGNYIFQATDITGTPITVTQTGTVNFVALITDKTPSTFTAPGGSVTADGVATKTLTATIKNKNSIGIAGKTVSVTQLTGPSGGTATITTVSNPTNNTGLATFTVSATKAGTYTFQATDSTSGVALDDAGDIVTVDFIAGAVDPNVAHSTLTTDHTSRLANGIEVATLTATMNDTQDNPVIDKTVLFAKTAGPSAETITPVNCPFPEPAGTAPGKTNINGKACATASTLQDGVYSFNATETDDIPNVTIDQTVNVTYTGPSAGDSTLTATPVSVVANGSSSSTVTATIKDNASNVFPGRSVTLSKTSGIGSPIISAIDCTAGTSLGTGANSTTDSLGKACYKVTSVNRAHDTFKARDNTESFDITQTASIDFTDGPVWADASGKAIANAVDDNSTYFTTTRTKVIRTGDGNYITSWADNRTDTLGSYNDNYAVYAQKFNSAGVPQWAPTDKGILIGNNTNGANAYILKYTNYIIGDNANGAIITWIDYNDSSGFYELRGQRVDPNGNLLWAGAYKVLAPQVNVNNALTNYFIIEDGEGGAFISYRPTNQEMVTRINASGNVVTGDPTNWPTQISTNVCSGPSDASLTLIRAGVVRAAWMEPDNSVGCGHLNVNFPTRFTVLNGSNDDYLNSILSTYYATQIVPSDLIPFNCQTPFSQIIKKVVEDGSGGVYVLFNEECSSSPFQTQDNNMVYLNHIGSFNSGLQQWSLQLTEADLNGSGGGGPAGDMISDGNGGVILMFQNLQDNGSGLPIPRGYSYAYRVTTTGTGGASTAQFLWNGGNRVLIGADLSGFEIVPGPSVGTADIIYAKVISASPLSYGVANAKQFTSSGTLAPGWGPDGIPISHMRTVGAFENIYATSKPLNEIVGDGAGGFVFANDGNTFFNHGFVNAPYIQPWDNYIQSVSSTGALNWNSGNDIEISPGIDLQNTILRGQANPQIVKSNNGDMIVAWQDEASWSYYGSAPTPAGGSRYDHYAQYTIAAEKLGTDGSLKWNPYFPGRGVPAIFNDAPTIANNTDLTIAADETGNAPNGALLMAWRRSNTTATSDIVIQQLDNTGHRNATWDISENGRVVNAGNNDYTPYLISDGNGGAFMTWMADSGSFPGNDIMVGKIRSSDGSLDPAWTGLNHLNITNTNSIVETNPRLVRDGSGNLLVAYEKQFTAGNKDIVVTKVRESDGTTLSVQTIVSAAGNQSLTDILADGSGGMYLAYTDDSAGATSKKVYVQHINSSLARQWNLVNPLGVLVSSTSNNNDNPKFTTDNNNGLIVTWEQYNSALTASDIAVQRINSSGTKLWNDGTIITDSSVTVLKQNPQIVRDGDNASFPTNGAVITWSQADPTPPGQYIYAQRVVNGIGEWGTHGLQLSSLSARTDSAPKMIGDDNGGGTVAWEGHASPPDVFGQSAFEADHSYNSTFTSSPGSAPADGTTPSVLTATLLDQNDLPVEGRTITPEVVLGNVGSVSFNPVSDVTNCPGASSPGVTNSSGQACFEVTSTTDGLFRFTATDTTDPGNLNTISQTADVNFTPQVSASNSTFTSSPGTMPADGLTEGFLTALVKSSSSTPVEGVTVVPSQIGGSGLVSISPSSAVTDSKGRAEFIITSSTTELATFKATLDGTTEITDHPTVNFVDPPTLIAINPDHGPTSGGTNVTITGTNFFTPGFHRRAVTVSNGGSAIGTPYAIHFALNTQALIAAGQMQSDCDDLRVLDLDGYTNVPYWWDPMECNTSETNVWAKISSVPSGDSTIYITFGDVNLTTPTNQAMGDAVFDFFDTFDSDSFGTVWDRNDATLGPTSIFPGGTTPPYIDIANSRAVLDYNDAVQTQTFTTTRPTTVEAKMKATSNSGDMGTVLLRDAPANTLIDNSDYLSIMRSNGANLRICILSSCSNYGPAFSTFLSPDTWYLNKLYLSTFTVQSEIDDFQLNQYSAEGIGNTAYNTVKVGLDSFFTGSGGDLTYVDYVRVRPFISPEIYSFASLTDEPYVQFCDPTCFSLNSVSVVDSGTITANTPAHAPQFVDLKVTNSAAHTATLASAFEYIPPPTVTGINPNHGLSNTTVSVTITGSDFRTGATANIAKAGETDIACGTPNVVDPSTITCSLDLTGAVSGFWDVVVTNPDGQSASLANGFTVELPPSSSLSTFVANPTSVPADNTSTTTLTATLLDGASVPLIDKPINVREVSGPTGTRTTTPATCLSGPASSDGYTNSSGEACYTSKSDYRGNVVYEASTTDVTQSDPGTNLYNSSEGTLIPGSQGTGVEVAQTLPFEAALYAHSSTTAYFCSNGGISIGISIAAWCASPGGPPPANTSLIAANYAPFFTTDTTAPFDSTNGVYYSSTPTEAHFRYKGNVVGPGNTNVGSVEYTVIIKQSGVIEIHYGPIVDSNPPNGTGIYDGQLNNFVVGTAIMALPDGTSMSNHQIRFTPDRTVITQEPTVTYTCVVTPSEQCLGIIITPSTLTVSAPSDFTFGSVSSGTPGFSKNDPTYLLNSNDVVTVTDGRGVSGFNLQVQAESTGFGNGSGSYLPLQNLWVGTGGSSTGGTTHNGVEYAGSDTNPETIVAPQDTTGSLLSAGSFTSCGSALGSGSTFTTPGTPTPVDLMLGGLSSDGRVGTFKQNVNYYLDAPSGQPTGNYSITLTYTVTDSNVDPPSFPASCP